MLAEEYAAIHCEKPENYEDFKKREAKLPAAVNGSPEREERDKEATMAIIKDMHCKKRVALCISGGGIRSATFSLGVLQGLASKGLLGKFHYLSTVSGGGYIGSWLTAWLHHVGNPGPVPGNFAVAKDWNRLRNEAVIRVQEELKEARDTKKAQDKAEDADGRRTQGDKEIPNASAGRDPLHPEPKPLVHLREYSRYLSPRLGFLSADTWTLVSIYLRNLLLNWLVIVPWLFVALLIPRFYTQVLRWTPEITAGYIVEAAQVGDRLSGFLWMSVWAGLYGLSILIASVGMIAAILYMGKNLLGSQPIKDVAAIPGAQTQFLRKCLLPLILASAALTCLGYWERYPIKKYPAAFYIGMALFGALIHAIPAAWLAIRSGKSECGSEKMPPGETEQQCEEGDTHEKSCRQHRTIAMLTRLGAIILSGATGGVVWVWLFNQCIKNIDDHTAGFACLGPGLFFASFLLGMTIFIGIISRIRERPYCKVQAATDENREWWARAGAWVLLFGLVWMILASISLYGPRYLALGFKQITAVGGISGLVTVILGASAKSGGKTEDNAGKPGLAEKLVANAPAVAAPIFLVSLLILFSLLTTLLVYHFDSFGTAPSKEEVAAAAPRDNELPPDAAGPSANGGPEADSDGLDTSIAKRIAVAEHDEFEETVHAREREFLNESMNGETEMEFKHKREFIEGLDKTKPTGRQSDISDWQETQFAKASIPWLPPGYFHHEQVVEKETWRMLWALLLVFGALGAFGAVVNINTFSMHGMYRDRLIRAYLAASRPDDSRTPDPFTGFDQNDNIPMFALWPQVGECDPPGGNWACPRPLFHVICVTLNLVGGNNLAWQERMAASFTITPWHCGSADLANGYGYRRTTPKEDASEELGGSRYGGEKGVSLGTAMTISGAAVNPNWGYHSSPVVTFLLTLFNARLGWWLGNPSDAGDAPSKGGVTYNRWYPRSGIDTLMREALGMTDETYGYVDLSDGGHFDNMGLYEMVRRRCHIIVLIDAEEDQSFSFDGLGMAIRKIRIDFGIPIEFPRNEALFEPKDPDAGDYLPAETDAKVPRSAVGCIRYSAVDRGVTDGALLYLKPVCYGKGGGEPRDVAQYKRSHPTFPHETTADQFFTESQFESYRALGRYTIQEVMNAFAPQSIHNRNEVHGFLRELFS